MTPADLRTLPVGYVDVCEQAARLADTFDAFSDVFADRLPDDEDEE